MPPAPGQWRTSGQSSSGEFWSQARPSGCRTGILLHLYALHIAGAPRSAATFNSKACQLWEARNASYGTSEREPPEGTAAFYTRSVHQLSTWESLPPWHSLAPGRDLCVGWSVPFIMVAPGPSIVLGGPQHVGAMSLGALLHLEHL